MLMHLKGQWENTWLHHNFTVLPPGMVGMGMNHYFQPILHLLQYYHHKVMEKSCFINRLECLVTEYLCDHSEQSKLLFLLIPPPSIRFLMSSVAGEPMNFKLTILTMTGKPHVS